MTAIRKWSLYGVVALLSVAVTGICQADAIDKITFDDQPLEEGLVHPDWFKLSFLDINEDVTEARENGKRGVIIYFGQKFCPYCKAHLDNNWGRQDIINYTQQNFDVIAIDVKGQKQVTALDGKSYTEKQYAAMMQTNFTPSILFINNHGKEVLRLRGYRPPYQFRAALEYVADDHYQKEGFRDYLARAEAASSFGRDELNEHEAFLKPPYALDRSHVRASRPLLVAFERRKCHSCDILHGGPLSHTEIIQLLKGMDVVQLDIDSDTPVLTPAGKKLTAAQWSRKLNIDYTPTLVFFDGQGKEIIRIDSVVWFYRLRNVLRYVDSKAYLEYPTFQLWKDRDSRK